MTREEKAAAMAAPMMHLLDEFCEANGRVPSTGEIVMWKQAQASGLDHRETPAGAGTSRGHRHDWRRDEFTSGVGAGTIMRRVCDTMGCGLVEVDHGRGWRRP